MEKNNGIKYYGNVSYYRLIVSEMSKRQTKELICRYEIHVALSSYFEQYELRNRNFKRLLHPKIETINLGRVNLDSNTFPQTHRINE